MKTKLFFLLTLAAGLMFTSCKKDNDLDPTPKGDSHFFTCMLDGEAYVSEGFNAYCSDFDPTINVYGVSEANIYDAIYVQVPKAGLSEGSYDLGSELIAIVSINDKSYSTALEGGNGTVTVTHWDGENMKGKLPI